MNVSIKNLVIVRGAGDISTGTIHRLFRAGFPVLALESARPSAIRRRVAFSEAVYDGSTTVEGVTAVRIEENAPSTAELPYDFDETFREMTEWSDEEMRLLYNNRKAE